MKDIKKELANYYSQFSNIYSKENYPQWFEFFTQYNHDNNFGELGYINNRQDHELGHYAIFQTPIPELSNPKEKTKIIIVGKNNSWFIPVARRVKESLEIVKNLKSGIPSRNLYLEKESKFAKAICSIFSELGSYDLLEKNTVGMNRIWLQTGPDASFIKYMKEERKGASFQEKILGSSLVDICHRWTEEIIELLNPELVLLLGTNPNGADNLFSKKEGIYEHANGSFFIKHCRHPSNGGRPETLKHIGEGLELIGS